ncbi:hypothetical protein PIB30_007993 [Stylosanthes scabra]|uniref:Glycosyltransferase n=1 Tax=Stylosanthes scabra TaxID=79078 RepID=A0ABU6U531_9FABA|nr:hypothetical protein [Stylosanthes scabra]
MDSTLPSNSSNLHFVFIPFMTPGHLLPMVDMAKLLARRKVKVTIITTPLNSIQFQATIEREVQSGSPIQIELVPFPHAESGIPEGCESVDTLPSMDLAVNFYRALILLKKPLQEVLEKLTPTPSCIISDKIITCVADIAEKFQVPRILFDGTNCFHLLCNHYLHVTKAYEAISSKDMFLLPGIPDRIELRRSQLPGIFNPGKNPEWNHYRQQVKESEGRSYGVVVNSFEELEGDYVKEYERVTGLKVWCIGPVSLSNQDNLDRALRSKRYSNQEDEDGNKYLKWLDSWPSRSVIYVCLGSLTRATTEQLIELGFGLEATNRPFIWVIKGAYKREEMDTWLLESGFEERVKGRGILIKGWAPQVLILNHEAIGAFLTHCGWNSTLEGISAGVPLVTFPFFAEQFYNEKVVVQLVECGVSVGAESVVHLGEEDECVVQVSRENVKDGVEKVMGKGEECDKIRERAREYGTMAKRAVQEGGSSYCNMTRLIEEIKNV